MVQVQVHVLRRSLKNFIKAMSLLLLYALWGALKCLSQNSQKPGESSRPEQHLLDQSSSLWASRVRSFCSLAAGTFPVKWRRIKYDKITSVPQSVSQELKLCYFVRWSTKARTRVHEHFSMKQLEEQIPFKAFHKDALIFWGSESVPPCCDPYFNHPSCFVEDTWIDNAIGIRGRVW